MSKVLTDDEMLSSLNGGAQTPPKTMTDDEMASVGAVSSPTMTDEEMSKSQPTISKNSPAAKFSAMLADPQGAVRLQNIAASFGTTVEDPQFQARMQEPLGFRAYTTLSQLADTGNPDEANDLDEKGNPKGLGLKAALSMFGQASGTMRKRNDALISRLAAGQELEVFTDRDPKEQVPGMTGVAAPVKRYKKVEDMTRAEQDAAVPKEILDIVNQYDTPETPMDSQSRAKAIYDAAKSGAMSREHLRRSASEELAVREELTGKSDGFWNTAGNLAAKGMPTVGYGNTFLVGGAMGGGMLGAVAIPALVSGASKTTELLSADIDPDTGKATKMGADYGTARTRGYAYGAFESASEVGTGRVLGTAFKALDKVTGGYVSKVGSKGLDWAAGQLAKTGVGRGIAEFVKGVQRVAGLSALNNPGIELLEEGVQQWDEKVFAQRPSDTETAVYARNVLNEGTGEIEQAPITPGSEEEKEAKRLLTRYGEKSGIVETGKRQLSVGEKTKEFNDQFYTWDNMGALAEGFALQYALTLGGGALHAMKNNRETNRIINDQLMAAGADNATLIRMTDEQKAEAYNKYYGSEANREEFAKVFKDAGELLSQTAQRLQDTINWDQNGRLEKPNFDTKAAQKSFEEGAMLVEDEKSGINVDQQVSLDGTVFTSQDRDGELVPRRSFTLEDAMKDAEYMSQLKQGRAMDMNKRAEVATQVANVFAPGRTLILVQNDADMRRAARDEGADDAGYKSGNGGLTTPTGSIVVNVAAVKDFDDMVYIIKHETQHSVGDETGLNALLKTTDLNTLVGQMQKTHIIERGEASKAAFLKAVGDKRAAYAKRGVNLSLGGAVEEQLSEMQEGAIPVFRKKFGDGLADLFAKRGAAAENIQDARRMVARIMHSGKKPEITMYGGKDAWNAPAPAFEGDPLAEKPGSKAAAPATDAPEAPGKPAEKPSSDISAILVGDLTRNGMARDEAVALVDDAINAEDDATFERRMRNLNEAGASTLGLGSLRAAREEKRKTAAPVVEAPAAPAEVAKPTKGKGFTHATVAREYFFDSGAGAMKSTGYLFNAFAGAFPRAHTQLRDVLENHKASIDSTQDDIRALSQTPEWGAIKADVAAAVEQAYGVNSVEARAIAEEMLKSPTGTTVKSGKALSARLDALEEKMDTPPAEVEAPATVNPEVKPEAPTPEPAPVAVEPEVVPPTPVVKMTFPSEEAFAEYVGAHPEETAQWTDDNFEIVPNPEPAQSDTAAIEPTPDAGRGEAVEPKAEKKPEEAPRNDGSLFPEQEIPFNLEGAEQEDATRVAAEKKAEEDRLAEIQRKKDAEPILPGIDTKEVQNADSEREATPVAGGEQAGSAEANGGGNAEGQAPGDAGDAEVGNDAGGEVALEAPQIARQSAEVEFSAVPEKGQYVEIPGVSTAQGKRMYLIQGKWGDGSTFHVSPTHHGTVLTGMGALLRTKGKPSTHAGVRIIGGGKAPAGSEKWGVAEWATHNQQLVKRHKEGAKAAPKAPIVPKSDAKPVEAPKKSDSIKTAKTGVPFKARLMRGEGGGVSPYNEGVPEEPVFGPGRYTTDDKEMALDFGPNITEHDVELKNPLVIHDDEEWRAVTKAAGWKYLNNYGLPLDEISRLHKALRSTIEKMGHDGVIIDPVSRRLGDDAKSLWNVAGGPQVVEFGKAAPVAEVTPPAPKMKFASEEEMMRYVSAHPEETANWKGDEFEIVPGEAAPAESAPAAEAVPPAPVEEQFVPPKKSLGEPEIKYRKRVAAAEAEWKAARAPKETVPEAIARAESETATPSAGQKEVGNYKKGRFTVHGMEIAVENPVGSIRSGVTKEGKPWRTEMKNSYGYFAGETDGKDGDKLDVFLGPDVEGAPTVYVVDQVDPATGEFDEHKVMLGFPSEDAARLAYQSNYQAGWKGLKTITGVSVEVFKAWMASSDRKLKPFAEYAVVKNSSVVESVKDAEEDAEMQANVETSARVDAIPSDVYIDNPALAVMDVELPAYEARKPSATRTADSKERQAYSTPPPLAAIGAAALAGAGGGNADTVTVIEPTAGNGGLIAVLGLSEGDKVLANELDEGRAKRLRETFLDVTVTQGDYAAEAYQNAIVEAGKTGPRAFLMNPPFGPADESGLKLEHRIALKTIESAKPGDTMFFIGAAPGRNAMTALPGALAGVYTSGAFAKFHQELNRQGWKATLHFIADGALYRKMGASFPVEVLLMEKTDGKVLNTHMPMRDLPARYSTWEQIRAAVAEMYEPGAETVGERVAADLDLFGLADKARKEANDNAAASSDEVNADRVNEGTAAAPRYRLSQDIELGLVTPETSLTLSPLMLTVNGKTWDREFAGKVHNPTQLAEAILALPAELAEARIKVADAIAKHLAANPANRFHLEGVNFSMGPALREAFEARWNADRPSDVDTEEDKAQLEYIPLSDVEVASPMKMPRELAGGMGTALDAFAERHPEGIDAFVAEKMGWTLEQATDGRLDGSQIDTLGLALEKIDEGTGFIVGSQTGAGKGRVMAAIMVYHLKHGRIPIFLTAQAKLFTDIWGDITAIGEAKLFKQLVLNDYKAPKSEDPDADDEDAFTMPVFFAPVQRAAALAEGKLPTGANSLFLTYSQVQNPTLNTQRKIDLILRLLNSGTAALVMDEAHLAAGADSRRGTVLREFADLSKPGVVFSSATFAKRGENMDLYKRAGYSLFFKNDDELEQVLNVGGVPFQQYLAARLTERGFYIRHELDYEGVKFGKMTTIDTLGTPQERTALSQREEQIADVYNQVVRTVMRFGGMVRAINSRLQKGAPSAQMDGAAFMSSLHNTASFIYTALKAETVANAAVQALREGKAPVVTLYNTNQALLTEIGIGENADVGRYLTRIAQRAVSIVMPDGSTESILTTRGFNELVNLVKAQEAAMLRDAADALVRQSNSAAEYLREQNLPASPIDRVREVVENAGFNFAEVTGRSIMVRNGVVVRRLKPNPDEVVRQFNHSVTKTVVYNEQGEQIGVQNMPNTVLLLNSSGATGLSAQASRAFLNQAQRVMFILQPSWDINEMMQMFGRVNRKNQVSKPIYHLVFTSAAGEQRNAAILMSKLRSLSANTSGVSKAGYGETAEDALDFMNSFGDRALAELAAERNPVVASINALRASTAIRSATSISQFLPVREQEQFIGQIQAKVAALQDNAREAGLHDLEAGDIGRVPLTVEQLLSNSAMRAYEVPVIGKTKILTAAEAQEMATAWRAKHPSLLEDSKAKIEKAANETSNPWLHRIYGDTAQVLEHAVDSIGEVFSVRDDVGSGRRWFIPMEIHLPASGTAQTSSDWRVKVSFNTIRGVTTIPLSIFADRLLGNAARTYSDSYNDNLTRKEDRTLIAGDVAQALIGNIVSSGANGASQIVRARPVDGNFSSFVLMMPRGITVSTAKHIVSARLVPVTDIKEIPAGRKGEAGKIDIDAGRITVQNVHDRYAEITGAIIGFRMATPNKAKTKDISVAQLMRGTGFADILTKTPNSRGYVESDFIGVERANKVLADLAKLSPYLAATQVVSDDGKVGGQDSPTASAPTPTAPNRYRIAEPVFFSQLRRTLEAKMPNRMTVMALRGMLDPSRSGIKSEELEWSGLKDFLDGKNPGDFVTKAEVLAAAKDVQIEEVLKGGVELKRDFNDKMIEKYGTARWDVDATPEELNHWEKLPDDYAGLSTKFEQYQLAGGENYRELLLTLPSNQGRIDTLQQQKDAIYGRESAEFVQHPEWQAEWDKLNAEQKALKDSKFQSSHFPEPNILVHVRFNERLSYPTGVGARGVQTKGDETGANGLSANAKRLTDLVETDAFRTQGLSGLNVEQREAVKASVIGAIGDEQVRRRVIENIPVDVMNDLGRLQLSPEQFLNDKAVLSDSLSLRLDAPVLLSPAATSSLVRAAARLATERVSASFELTGKSVNGNSAGETGGFHGPYRTLFLEEVQSDFHQTGREKGYGVPGGVPNAPFKDTSKGWARLAMKRMVRWAAENGFARIAWTTGEQQAERYDLSKKIERVSYNDLTGQLMAWEVGAYGNPGRLPVLRETIPIEKSADYVGKEAAQKLIATTPVNDVRSISGDDLRVGGEGMRTFYDQILPSIANDLGKKFGARVEDATLGTEVNGYAILLNGVPVNQDRYATAEQAHVVMRQRGLVGAGYGTSYHDEGTVTAHSLPIPAAMSDSVMQGQPRFRLADPVLLGELRTQSQLENEADPGFPILDRIRGSRIIVPWITKGQGKWDWLNVMGGVAGFDRIYSLTTRLLLFKRPDIANHKGQSNIDSIANELGYDDMNQFADAFLAELDRSKAMYDAQKARIERRGSIVNDAKEHVLFKGKDKITEMMGRAVEYVYLTLPADAKADLEMLGSQAGGQEGEEQVRDYILNNHLEAVYKKMDEDYNFLGGTFVMDNAERPDNIQVDDYYTRPEVVNAEGDTVQTIRQTHARLMEIAATLPMQQPGNGDVATVTDEDAAAYVRNIIAEHEGFGESSLRDSAEFMIAERLLGRRDTALNTEQNAIMLWYFNDLNNQRKLLEVRAAEAARINDLAMVDLVAEEDTEVQRKTRDYINAKYTYGRLAGQALQSLQRRVDSGFSIVKIYQQALVDNGKIPLTTEQLRKLQARIDRLEKAWADYVEAAGLPDEEKGLEEKIAEMESALADLKTDHDTLKASVDELSKKRAALDAELAKQSVGANELSEKKAKLQAQIDNLEQEIVNRTALNRDVTALQARVDELTKRLAALEAEYAGASPEFLAELQQQLADLTKRYSEKQAQYVVAQEALKTAMERLNRVRKLLAKLPKKIAGKLQRRRAVLNEASNLYGVFKTEMEKAQVERLAARWRGADRPEDLGFWKTVGFLLKKYRNRADMSVAVTRDMIRGLQSMGDESVAGRQLAKLGLAHPFLWARAFAQSQQLVFIRAGARGEDGHLLTWAERSDRALFEQDATMREHPLFDVFVRKGGLSWMDLTADPQSFDEQQTPVGALLRNTLPRWTGVGGYTALLEVSNNHYAGMSNMLRFAAAAQLYGQWNVAKGETPSQEDVRAIVGIVDILGGRGDTSSDKAKAFLKGAKYLLYSPRLALSNVQFFTRAATFALNPDTSAKAKAMIATEYLRVGATYAALATIAWMLSKMLSDDPDEQRHLLHPGHTSFLNFMRGQRRMDVTGGAAMWARSVSQILGIGDKLSTETGMVITPDEKRQNIEDSAIMRLVRSKLDPWSGMMYDLVAGKTYSGQAAGPRAKENFPDYGMRYPNMFKGIAPIPLSIQSFADLLRGDVEQGIAPLRNPLLILDSMGAQFLGTGASSLPINSEVSQEVADGNLRHATQIESLRKKQGRLMSDKKKSPEFKELRAQRLQDRLDQLRDL